MIKVLDFGLAKVAREEKIEGGLTLEGQALGTPDYIAPEQILDAQSADIRADIYSLGGTLYFVLTGRPPFQANSLYDVYQAHISRNADPLNVVRPEVPSELAAVVAKMMAKDPARRFQTPGEVAVALKPFLRTANAVKVPRPDVSLADQTHADRPKTRAVSQSTQPRPASDAGSKEANAQRAADTSAAGSRWEGLIDLGHAQPESNDTPAPNPGQRPPWTSWPVALSASLFGLIVLGVIIITIRDRAGRVTDKVVVPDGSTVTVESARDEVPIHPDRAGAADQVKPRPSTDSQSVDGALPVTTATQSPLPADGTKAVERKENPGEIANRPPSPIGYESSGLPIYQVRVPLVRGGTLECRTTNPAAWKLHDGLLLFEPGEPDTHGLYTQSDYKDFELRLKAKCPWGSFPGIVFRGVSGIPGPVLASSGSRDARILYRNARLYSIPDSLYTKLIKTDVFNEYVIQCKKKQITIKLNGTVIVSGDFPAIADEGNIGIYHSSAPMTFKEIDLVILEGE